MNRRTIGIGVAALALATATGAVVGAQLTDGSEPARRDTVVRPVSDQGSITASPVQTTTPPAESPEPVKSTPAPAKKPEKASEQKTDENRRQAVPEPAPEPTQTENTVPDQPAPPPPPATIRRCYDNDGVEYPCPRN